MLKRGNCRVLGTTKNSAKFKLIVWDFHLTVTRVNCQWTNLNSGFSPAEEKRKTRFSLFRSTGFNDAKKREWCCCWCYYDVISHYLAAVRKLWTTVIFNNSCFSLFFYQYSVSARTFAACIDNVSLFKVFFCWQNP